MASIKVAVRVRPFNQREREMDAKLIVEMDGNKTRLQKPKLPSAIRDASQRNGDMMATNDFTFDHSYWSIDASDPCYTSQEQVYNDLGMDVIKCAFQGYNACVFAYGQTGSGKTFTMMGTLESQGLIPRICKEMFLRMKKDQEMGTGYKTHVSYLEIYNERVRDLLGPMAMEHGLRVREHKQHGPYVEDLSQHTVSNYDEIQKCINKGNQLRTTASTQMNDTSSRSHAIFTITFAKAGFVEGMPSETVSKIHLVDLAGSERCNATGATGQRLKEGGHINKSLVTLGSVISALAEQSQTNNSKRVIHIPYRDSILTWLLKDSLGGNSKTIMIAAISPADCNYSETLSTLRYANRAKNIINKPTINEDSNVKLIRELRDEIKKLKSMLTGGEMAGIKLIPEKLFEDILKKEAQEKVLTEEWTQKWREAQQILREQKALGLRMAGVGVVLDSDAPHLIGIQDDINTGVTLYSLKEGSETFIGSEHSEQCPDIILSGVGINPNHCSIRLENGCATIYPMPNAQCWLNAYLIDEPTQIRQGDILLLGRTNMFRYNNPTEAARLRIDGGRSRLDLSRVSFIAASREDLFNGSCFSDDDVPFNSPAKREQRQFGSLPAPPPPSSQSHPPPPASTGAAADEITSYDDSKLKNEHQKLIEAIEHALGRINAEKINIHEQYRKRVKALSDELIELEMDQSDKVAILKCRERKLLAQKEMLLWEKNNTKSEIDISIRQISALQTQLECKRTDLDTFVGKVFHELEDCGKFDEMKYGSAATSYDTDNLCKALFDKASNLSDDISIQIKETINKNQTELGTIAIDLKSKETELNERTIQLATIDEKIHDIQNEERKLIIARTECELEAMKLKKQSLNLNVIPSVNDSCETETEMKTALETCDTFHTATSNCSNDQNDCFLVSETVAEPQNHDQSEQHQQPDESNVSNSHQIYSPMTDSGVSIETNKKSSNLLLSSSTPNKLHRFTNTNTNTNGGHSRPPHESDDNNTSCSSSCDNESEFLSQSICSMHKLRKRIAIQKAQIMKSLEIDCDKSILDHKIARLQDLQKQYFQMKRLNLSKMTLNCSNTNGRRCCFFHDDDDDDVHDGVGGIHFGCGDEDLDCSTTASSDEMNLKSPVSTDLEPFYESTLTRSLPIAMESEYYISIPSFIVRGAGKQTHYEYEIVCTLPNERWTILRRYSRFRELHLSMCALYGKSISQLPFPRRELFTLNGEAVARNRRRRLELYLRSLLVVCSKIPKSPIYEGDGANGPGLCKNSLIELAQFFQKGLFECGKHGTG